MKTELTINVRAFHVKVLENSTGDKREEIVVLTKDHLHAAQLVGQSSKELITRLCSRAGFTVLDIGSADFREININLDELYKAHSLHQLGKREKVEV